MKDQYKTKSQLINELISLRQQLVNLKTPEGTSGSAEDMLRLYENIVSVTKDRLAFVDKNYIYQAVNSSYAQACNKKQDDVLGHTVSEVLGKNSFNNLKKYLDKCFAGESVRFQSWFRSLTTGQEYLDVRYQPFFDSDGSVFGVVVSSRDITDRRNAEEARIKEAAALARSEELNHSRQRIVAAQETLRKQLAQQLHGTVQTKIILILHQLSELRKDVTDTDVLEGLNELRREIKNLLEIDIRTLSRQLYPSILRQGLIPALQSLGDQLEKQVQINMKLDEKLVKQEQARHRFIPEKVKQAVFRITEEALNNIIKYSQATNATVELKYFPESRIQVKIEDNGQGFDIANATWGLGMDIIQSYAEITGGEYSVDSSPGKGTKITAVLPLQNQNDDETEF